MPPGDADIEAAMPNPKERLRKSWKYIGYPAFISFMASDADLMVFRRFDKLHIRAILVLQNKLSELEEQLDRLDTRYSTGDEDVNNGTLRGDKPKRQKLHDELIPSLNAYDKILLQYSTLLSQPKPRTWIPESLQHWFDHNWYPIAKNEASFVKCREDLISVKPSAKALVRELFDYFVVVHTGSIFRFFKKAPPASGGFWDSGKVLISDNDKVEQFVAAVMFIVGLILLITPLWILQSVHSATFKLVVITIFLLTCVGLLSFATSGRPFQILAAAAGYAAILVVFVQPGNSCGH